MASMEGSFWLPNMTPVLQLADLCLSPHEARTAQLESEFCKKARVLRLGFSVKGED